MRTARELLQAYLDNVRDPAAAAALFADDGVLELPTMKIHAAGPAQVQSLVTGILRRVPDFRFKDFKVWIDTPDKVFGSTPSKPWSQRPASCIGRPTQAS